MEATLGEHGRQNRVDGQAAADPAGEALNKLRNAGSREMRDLMADVQDLLGKVAHVADPEIARLRMKVEGGLATAKKTLASGAEQVQKSGREAMAASDDYVRGSPWQAMGVAAIAGLLVGFMVGRR